MNMHATSVCGLGLPAITEFPRYVMYDVNNVCNARCPFCPQSAIARQADFKPMHLDWDIYVKTIDEVARHEVDLIRFTGDGEPLLHPRIAEMIARAVLAGVGKVNLTTNGSLLRGERMERLLATPPHILDVSLDAASPETYAKYRAGLDFDTTLKNVLDFLGRRDPARTKVIVSMILHPGLEDEARRFESFWLGKADHVAIRRLHSNLGAVDVPQGPLPERRWPCVHLWQRLVVDFRGHIRFCPVDWADRSFVGEAAAMSLKDAWHGKLLGQLRQAHGSGAYANCGVCEKCMDWANTPWDETWVRMVERVMAGGAAGG